MRVVVAGVLVLACGGAEDRELFGVGGVPGAGGTQSEGGAPTAAGTGGMPSGGSEAAPGGSAGEPAGQGGSSPTGGSGGVQWGASGSAGEGGSPEPDAGPSVYGHCSSRSVKMCGGVCQTAGPGNGCDEDTCTPCDQIANADAKCYLGACVSECRFGYSMYLGVCEAIIGPCSEGSKYCGGVCRSGWQVGCDAVTCAPCPEVENGTPICTVTGDCGYQCSGGFVDNGVSCVPD